MIGVNGVGLYSSKNNKYSKEGIKPQIIYSDLYKNFKT